MEEDPVRQAVVGSSGYDSEDESDDVITINEPSSPPSPPQHSQPSPPPQQQQQQQQQQQRQHSSPGLAPPFEAWDPFHDSSAHHRDGTRYQVHPTADGSSASLDSSEDAALRPPLGYATDFDAMGYVSGYVVADGGAAPESAPASPKWARPDAGADEDGADVDEPLPDGYISDARPVTSAVEPPRRQEPSGAPPGSAMVVADSKAFVRNSLELEDLFAEILRKTGSSYGRQNLMEFLRMAALHFGERRLVQAIQSSVQIVMPTMVSDSGHLSRTVWNEKFQAALELRDSLDRNERLAALRSDFVSTAEFYGRIILAERFLPVYRKSIKPINIGGVAGGTKYLQQGVLYKFAEDVDMGPHGWMYSGTENRDDAAASKACGNELKGLTAVFQACAELDLRVPLMCLVDFGGFRLSAQAFVPITSETLVYGSQDAGRTIVSGKGQPEVLAMMSRLAERLHLEPHVVVDGRGEKHLMYTCTDIEVHRGLDGRYYLLDSSRLMPPQRPPRGAERAVFYQQFRPEFLTWYNNPLSSDGLTKFGMQNWKVHNRKILHATDVLIKQRIPEFAQAFNKSDVHHLTSLMHSWGINVRYLGHFRSCSHDPEVRLAALMEMVARTLQKMLQERLREEMSRIRAPQMAPYLHLVADYCNMLTSDSWFWKRPTLLKARIVSKFGHVALTESEHSPRVSLAPLLPMSSLFMRFLQLSGIQLRTGLLSSEDLHEPFVTSDFTIVPRITEMDIASLAVAEQYRRQAKRKVGANKVGLLRSAAEILQKAVVSNPTQPTLRLRWARVLLALLRVHIRSGTHHGNIDLYHQIERIRTSLLELRQRQSEHVCSELQLLESSLYRLMYHQHMNVQGAEAITLCLTYWARSYSLLMESFGNPNMLHIGLNVAARFPRRKSKRWTELLVGLEHVVTLGAFDECAASLCAIVSADFELAHFLVAALDGVPSRARLFCVLLEIFRRSPALMELLRVWITARRQLHVGQLTFEHLDDATVAKYLALCDSSVRTLNLTNCFITDDVLIMFSRVPHLESLVLKNCPLLDDSAVLTGCAALQDSLVHLDLTNCLLLTDLCLSRLKLPHLQTLNLSRCGSLRGDFLSRPGFPKLQSLRLDECWRIHKTAVARISVEAFSSLRSLSFAHLHHANSQSVSTLMKHHSLVTSLNLRNTSVADRLFRRPPPHLEALSLKSSDVEDDSVALLGLCPSLARLNLKMCIRVTNAGMQSFLRNRAPTCVPMTHLDLTDTPGMSPATLDALLCRLPGAPHSWRSLKLRGCEVPLATLRAVLESATNLCALSLSGRPEADLGDCHVVARSLESLHLESCAWSTTTLAQLLSSATRSVKIRSCPSFTVEALQVVLHTCTDLELLHLVALDLVPGSLDKASEMWRHLKWGDKLKHLVLQEVASMTDAVFATMHGVLPGLDSLSLRELPLTDVSWALITSEAKNLRGLKISNCKIRNSANRLLLLPRLQLLYLDANTKPPFEHGESAIELNQLRTLRADPQVCASEQNFCKISHSRTLQKLIVPAPVMPQWWSAFRDRPVCNSLQSVIVLGSPHLAFPQMRGLTRLVSINLRESVARTVLAEWPRAFPLLTFSPRSHLHKSRFSEGTAGSRGRQESLVRSILSTSASATATPTPTEELPLEDSGNTEDLSDAPVGWALLTEAQLPLQLAIGRLLLGTYGYRLVLVYRGNRTGGTDLLEFVQTQGDKVVMVKMSELFHESTLSTLHKRCGCIDLTVTGFAAPAGQEEHKEINNDLLRRTMQDIPYTVANVLQSIKPLIQRSTHKLVVVTGHPLGSIKDNFTGGMMSLRAATAALNSIAKSLSVEAEAWGGCVVVLTPASELFGSGGGGEEADSVDISAARMVKVMLELSVADNGKWYSTSRYDGRVIARPRGISVSSAN